MKIRRLIVATPQGASGVLDKESRYVFNYSTGERSCEASLTMPIRAESYASGALLTPFAMNKTKRYPSRKELLQFGADVCHVRDPQHVVERIATAMSESLAANRDRVDRGFLQQLSSEWDGGRLSAAVDR